MDVVAELVDVDGEEVVVVGVDELEDVGVGGHGDVGDPVPVAVSVGLVVPVGEGHGEPGVVGVDVVLVGGSTTWSPWPFPPVGRLKYWPVSGSKSTMTVTSTSAGWTTTTFWDRKVGHWVPVKVSDEVMAGGSSGLPHEQRARGTPWLSTRTAVPACRTDWKVVAWPLANPWLVTRVSARRTAGVRECR